MLVKSARGASLTVRRCLNLLVNRELSLQMNDFDVLAGGLLSPVIFVASQSRAVIPLSEVSLQCEPVLPMHAQSAPPSACVSDGDGFSVGL